MVCLDKAVHAQEEEAEGDQCTAKPLEILLVGESHLFRATNPDEKDIVNSVNFKDKLIIPWVWHRYAHPRSP